MVYKYPFVKKKEGIVKGQRRQARESALNSVCIAPGGNAETSNISLRVGNGRHIHRGGKGRGADTMSIRGRVPRQRVWVASQINMCEALC